MSQDNSANTVVRVGAGITTGTELLLTYEQADNIKPSTLAREAAGDCGVAPLTDAEKSRLCALDAIAWTTRKLRLYPAQLAALVTTRGAVRTNGVRVDSRTELLRFTGTTETTLPFAPTSISVTLGSASFWNAEGIAITPNVAYLGNGLIRLSEAAYGEVEVTYEVPYLEVILDVFDYPPETTFQVLVSGFLEGKATSVSVPFTPELCDGGVSAGSACIRDIVTGVTGGDEWMVETNWDDLIDQVVPPYVALVSMQHTSEVTLGDPFTVTMILQEINGAQASSVVTFDSGTGTTSASFQLDAFGSTSISFDVIASEAGFFSTIGDSGDFFSRQYGTITVEDPDAVPVEWNEVDRTMSTVDVGTAPNIVTVQRIEDVTFESPTGRQTKFIFDNTDVS